MPLSSAVRLVTHLNMMGPAAALTERAHPSADVVAHTIRAQDVAHHVSDPEGLLGLPDHGASPLDEALTAALRQRNTQPDPEAGWLLAVPRPSRLGPVRGPLPLTRAALEAGAAVIPTWGGAAWVPWRVGPAIQWEIVAAERPFPSPSSAEAEQALSRAILQATAELQDLGMTSGRRPTPTSLPMASGYPERQRRAAERALLLVQAVDNALADDSGILHSHAITSRAATLREVQQAALDSLQAACAWHPDSR